ncbi:AP complex subunit sigma [Mycena chlorophos]|uniref:AP complex subunit sigma n=1 Tax=Mycena chlorophos TaxID=658473 RepID=A0A8H6T466_MYCCL|nr:AP complex subunit sigma [Mycena chlorophos]
MLNYVLLISRQGKVRLSKWYKTTPAKQRARIVQEVTTRVLARRPRMCNVLELQGSRIIYRRYASLYFVVCIDDGDNELLTLEIIHRFVETLDRFFGQVTELDLIFNFQSGHAVLDELLLAGELQESSKAVALRSVQASNAFESSETIHNALRESSLV